MSDDRWHHFLIEVTHRDPGHTHFKLRSGRMPHGRGLAGELVLRTDEFDALVSFLTRGLSILRRGPVEVELQYHLECIVGPENFPHPGVWPEGGSTQRRQDASGYERIVVHRDGDPRNNDVDNLSIIEKGGAS